MRYQERDTRNTVASVAEWGLRLGTTMLLTVGGLAMLASPAWADDLSAPAPANFGLVGPVGLIAVSVGVLGMIAGVARRRRNALGRSVVARSAAAEQVTAARAEQAAGEQHVPGPSQPPAVESAAPQHAASRR